MVGPQGEDGRVGRAAGCDVLFERVAQRWHEEVILQLTVAGWQRQSVGASSIRCDVRGFSLDFGQDSVCFEQGGPERVRHGSVIGALPVQQSRHRVTVGQADGWLVVVIQRTREGRLKAASSWSASMTGPGQGW